MRNFSFFNVLAVAVLVAASVVVAQNPRYVVTEKNGSFFYEKNSSGIYSINFSAIQNAINAIINDAKSSSSNAFTIQFGNNGGALNIGGDYIVLTPYPPPASCSNGNGFEVTLEGGIVSSVGGNALEIRCDVSMINNANITNNNVSGNAIFIDSSSHQIISGGTIANNIDANEFIEHSILQLKGNTTSISGNINVGTGKLELSNDFVCQSINLNFNPMGVYEKTVVKNGARCISDFTSLNPDYILATKGNDIVARKNDVQKYIITKSGSNFDISPSISCPSFSNLDLVVQCITTNATEPTYIIQFGNGSALDIGNVGEITISSYSEIVLTGEITSSYSGSGADNAVIKINGTRVFSELRINNSNSSNTINISSTATLTIIDTSAVIRKIFIEQYGRLYVSDYFNTVGKIKIEPSDYSEGTYLVYNGASKIDKFEIVNEKFYLKTIENNIVLGKNGFNSTHITGKKYSISYGRDGLSEIADVIVNICSSTCNDYTIEFNDLKLDSPVSFYGWDNLKLEGKITNLGSIEPVIYFESNLGSTKTLTIANLQIVNSADTAINGTLGKIIFTGTPNIQRIIKAAYMDVDTSGFNPGANIYTTEFSPGVSSSSIANAAKFNNNFKYHNEEYAFVPKAKDLVLKKKFIITHNGSQYLVAGSLSGTLQAAINTITWTEPKILQFGDNINDLPSGGDSIKFNGVSWNNSTLTGSCATCNIVVGIGVTVYIMADTLNSVTSIGTGKIILSGSPTIDKLAGTNTPIELDNFVPLVNNKYKVSYPNGSTAVAGGAQYIESFVTSSIWQGLTPEGVNLKVTYRKPDITFVPELIPKGTLNESYFLQFSVLVDGIPEVELQTFSKIAGELPTGLEFHTQHEGLFNYINGTPTEAGTFNFTLMVNVDMDGQMDQWYKQFTLVINKAQSTTPTELTYTSTQNSITVQAIAAASDQIVEYSIGQCGCKWQTEQTFNNLKPGTTYTISARIKESANNNASDTISISAVTQAKANYAGCAEPTNLTANYGDSLSSVSLGNAATSSWAWIDSLALVGNVGTNHHLAICTPPSDNYETVMARLPVTVSPGAELDPSVAYVTHNSIAMHPLVSPNGLQIEYAISLTNTPPGEWQTSVVFSNLTSGTEYFIFTRTSANNPTLVTKVSTLAETIPIYTVNFNLSGGTGLKPSDILIGQGQRISMIEPSTTGVAKAGFLNDGKWYVNAADTTAFNWEHLSAINGNTTLYLKWTPATISISTTSLPAATLDTPYSKSISVAMEKNAGGKVAYSITEGALPDGLSLNSSGTIAGKPTKTGRFSFTVAVENLSSGAKDTKNITMSVSPPVAAKQQYASGSAGSLEARVQKNTLYVSGLDIGKTWSIYSANGALVHKGVANTPNASATLNLKGVYYIKSNGSTLRVVR